MTQVNDSAPLRDLSSADQGIARKLQTMQTAFKASQVAHESRPIQFVGYVAQTSVDKSFTYDGMKTLYVSQSDFGAYRVPLVAAPKLREDLKLIGQALLTAHSAGCSNRPLRDAEVQQVETARDLIAAMLKEIEKC